jgi:hypothetical protein
MKLTTFPQAKLLKEKGYSEPTMNYFMLPNGIQYESEFKANYNAKKDHVSCPSLHSVLDWAREKHGVHGWVALIDPDRFQWNLRTPIVGFSSGMAKSFDSHDSCLSALVDEILKLIV